MVTKHREQAKVEVQGRMNRKQANKKKECTDLLQGLIIRKFKVMSQSQVRVILLKRQWVNRKLNQKKKYGLKY